MNHAGVPRVAGKRCTKATELAPNKFRKFAHGNLLENPELCDRPRQKTLTIPFLSLRNGQK